MSIFHRRPRGLALSFVALAVGVGCGSGGTSDTGRDASSTIGDDGGPTFMSTDGSSTFGGDDSGISHVFDVEPSALQTIAIKLGQAPPTVTYHATMDGQPAAAGWTVDRGDIGTMGTVGAASMATFQPTGSTGGLATVIAGALGQQVRRQVLVQLSGSQNGPNTSAPGEAAQIPATVADLASGGGLGGVGGEGLGVPVTDAPTLAAFGAPTSDGKDQSLGLLYPYDLTVFPRGILAPLLQWSWASGDADAIQIQLKTTSGSFTWTGTFGRPAILAMTSGKFIRHPIPQDVWTMATDSAGGTTPDGKPDRLTMSLMVAKGGKAYGPVNQTWTVAPARLAGTIYYNSYGTQLVKNSIEASKSGGQFGAAVLGIAQGALAPSVVAGTPSPLEPSPLKGSGCRVCHVVASNGSRLIVQHGDTYPRTSTYDLLNKNKELSLDTYDNLFGWAGLSSDGTLALTNAADLAASAPATRLYAFPPTSSTPLTVTGIPNDLKGGTPVFSPDTKHVAFDFLGGTIGGMTGNGTQLVSLDFDAKTNAFSNLKVLATMTGVKRAGFPTFFPTNDAVAFHYQIVNSSHRYNTWQGAEAQIWWSDLATGNASELYALNGHNPGGKTSYLPTGPNKHGDDTVLNYEPTVSPVASGGYIWVIFTSRRLYGNLATSDPWQSDPRQYDATNVANTTTKKLWVAAIDLNAPAGTDPSHPAFYLPAQELLAGNMRGFWVQDPCRGNGTSCSSGDQCCNGFCEPSTTETGNVDGGGNLVCTDMPPNAQCSQAQERCSVDADCCDGNSTCTNGFCAIPTPK